MEQGVQQFIKGFNDGYLLAEHEPVLISAILKTVEPKNDYLSGLISGKKEYEVEIEQAKIEELNQLRGTSKKRQKGFERE